MFAPKYTIDQKLLSNIKKISALITQINLKKYPSVVLHKFEIEARSVSAHASTSIEGNPLPLTDVKLLLKSQPDKMRDTEREVINYNNVLIWLDEQLKKSNIIKIKHDLVHKVHQKVMSGLLNKNLLFDYRKEPVFVNDPRVRRTVYWPPDHQDVDGLMEDLINYVNHNCDRIDPLILAGIFHKQFVVIHPYIDGNGRTVRLITKIILASMGLNTFNLFSFENYYNRNVTNYFSFVGERGNFYDLKDKIDFTSWLVYFTGGIIDELLRVGNELDKEAVSPKTSVSKDQQVLLEYIDKYGFITDKIYSTLTTHAKATRNLDFRKLISLGIVKMEGKGKAAFYKRS